MEMNEAIDVVLDHLRDHGTVEHEVENGPWLSVTWSADTDDGEVRGTVVQLKENEFRYSRTVSIGTIFVRSVVGQAETVTGGSADDVIGVATRLSNLKPVVERVNSGLNCRM